MKPSELKTNPNNPRIIKDDKFKKLVQSLKEFPEMATVRPVVIDENNVILGGNMRYKAMLEAGWDDIPVTQVKGWTGEQKKEFVIKDNVSGGEWDWDLLANNYDLPTLKSWGVDLPKDLQNNLSDEFSQKLGEVIYEPKETNHTIDDLFTKETKFDTEIASIKNEKLKEMLQARVSYFHTFNYSKIADYYAYQATPEEQKILEKLAFVLLDKDQLIEHGFSKIIDSLTK